LHSPTTHYSTILLGFSSIKSTNQRIDNQAMTLRNSEEEKREVSEVNGKWQAKGRKALIALFSN